jgi:hypothetical protein
MEPSGAFIYENGEIKQEMKPLLADLSDAGNEIKMENEFYSIYVVLDVMESAHNF